MNFDERFNCCIKNFQDTDKPDYSKSEVNYYADFIELNALFAKGDGVTFGDIQDKFFGEKDYENAEQENNEEYESSSEKYDKAEKQDKDENFLKEIFEIIKERQILFKDDYPFEYTENRILILKSILTLKNKLYLHLLSSSILTIFKPFNTELTTDFEQLAYRTMKNFLPEKAEIKAFGKNTQYEGNAKNKITQLAKDLNLTIKNRELQQINDKNTQERGLDIVAWLPFDDKCGNEVIFLCQCACGKEFEYKQHDTGRFENYLEFYRTEPQHTLFIPYSLINIRENKFYNDDVIEKGFLIFERKRILYLSNNGDVYNELKGKELIEKCILETII